MRTVSSEKCPKSDRGRALLGVIVNPDGSRSDVHECTARMATVGISGGPMTNALILAPAGKFPKYKKFDLLNDANRIKVCLPYMYDEARGVSVQAGADSQRIESVLAAAIKNCVKGSHVSVGTIDPIFLESFSKRLGDLHVADGQCLDVAQQKGDIAVEVFSTRALKAEDLDDWWDLVPTEWRPVMEDSVQATTQTHLKVGTMEAATKRTWKMTAGLTIGLGTLALGPLLAVVFGWNPFGWNPFGWNPFEEKNRDQLGREPFSWDWCSSRSDWWLMRHGSDSAHDAAHNYAERRRGACQVFGPPNVFDLLVVWRRMQTLSAPTDDYPAMIDGA
ncbi:putative transmembrane protein [Gregarina niphandrodes]|uniref:Transmembrane protein n=1 Tax=Gregarina niphandrodes TaxID=110365 RepID=A0A023AXS7_GRENI|nr:putative transmembrane protein [Gregarina niphandrodes]EZG43273.1 putative transmembrane protein [Gregarina niphandrodes]|eukprot:XP_011133467.1 putative transmembrane protein [Gregarina niphandrodes]